jgi:hypothetical protein
MAEIKFDSVKDSGARQEFATGARRDTQDDKPRYGLVPVEPLRRLAWHYTNGAKKYGENNWTKGIASSRSWESLERHVHDYKAGKTDEDHLAAVVWNAFAIMWNEERKPELHDLATYLMWPNAEATVVAVEDKPGLVRRFVQRLHEKGWIA